MSQPTPERLDSWKEIAEYLRRDLRTVRRWERTRELPIHRVRGGRRSAVYAFRQEIDTWLSASPTPDVNPEEEKETRASDVMPAPVSRELGYPENAQRFTPRFKFVAIASVILVVSGAILASLRREFVPSLTTSREAPPKIVSVTPILAQQNQTITIRGSGFGLHTPYKNADSPFIAIRDKTGGWAAGRLIPQNWDEITLNLESWQDDQIVVSGFAGAYGSDQWKLNRGDEVEIAIWNPQSGHGPALYHLIVSGEVNSSARVR